MRLIDADELLAQMIGMNDGWFDPRPAYDHESLIKIQPTVGAVPLDKLCEWLAGYAEPPLDALTICDNPFEAWKMTLTNWMEEQDAKEET